MRRTGPLALIAVLAAAFAAAATRSHASPPPRATLAFVAPAAREDTVLSRKLAKTLTGPHLDGTTSGAVVVDLATGLELFSYNGSRPLAPASNEKLAVTFALLKTYSPGLRIVTKVMAAGPVEDGVLQGRLVLVGGGDPTLSSGDLRRLAQRVRAAGIREVSGGVVGDESLFDGKRTVAGWEASFYKLESPPLSALVVDRARFRKRISSTPARAAAFLFREALRDQGVQVDGVISVRRAPADATLVASAKSGPLSSLIRSMDLNSDNFLAEQLLKLLALSRDEQGSSAGGARVVMRVLKDAGIATQGVRIVDGSGLSRLDRLTADALVGILQAFHHDAALERLLLRALPVAGRSGTLKHRMERPPLAGNLLAKTGTTSIASSLAGYVNGHVAFAIVQNGSPIPYWWARESQDRFATVLAKRAR